MSSISEEEITKAFDQFVKDFNKDYDSQSARMERRKAFAFNYKRITEFNKQPYKTFTLDVNMFADLTDDEFARKHLSSPKPAHHRAKNSWFYQEPNPNVVKNWVTEGKVTKVKDQGNCGSCWTFSSISVTETIFAIKDTIPPTRLSEQQLVDCCKTPLTKGCHGGEPSDAFEYIMKNGISLEKDYPYTARDDACKDFKAVMKLDNYVNISAGNNTIMEDVIQTRTMAVGINAAPFVFRFYKSGIVDSGCPDDPINHGVTIVGANVENGIPYWIVRNSWGPNWGEKGYIRLKRTSDGNNGICGIASCAQYVKYKDS